MRKIDELLIAAGKIQKEKQRPCSAIELSEATGMDRTTVSRYLNQLTREGAVLKREGRPVLFEVIEGLDKEVTPVVYKPSPDKKDLDLIIGAHDTLQVAVQQAKAAILYPPRGLHTLILGETGVGKSMFAELMYRYALSSHVIHTDAPFIKFNCADYAENPQLLVAQIFGVKKGAYTGAEKDREGLLKKADGGVLFLDEVHRLSPQGQEMLFTFIDKGHFRRLGDSEQLLNAEVQIIAATTEDTGSFLLKTFTRRIPMSITLPPLRERTLSERYELIKTFIREESKRVSKAIYVNRSALMSMLLYDCPNNIGQLKSDLQLSCAKAFLCCKAKNKNYMMVNQGDLPSHMKKGFMDQKEKREAIDQLLKNRDDILKFSYDEQEEEILDYSEPIDTHFYDSIEKKLEILKNSGIEAEEINNILNIDIEKHFQKYLGNLPERFKRDEIEKVVHVDVLDMVDYILSYAGEKLKKTYDEKLFFGLALHLHSSIERIRSGGKIYHPKLNVVRVSYGDEFLVAMEVAKAIDERFNIEITLDEIGYLTMFLASNPYVLDEDELVKVGVLVIMHGNSTASSMVTVANNLVGEDHGKAIDMPLNMKASEMYELVKEEVKSINRGKGVLLLVDMGSLTGFGEMLTEETGIIVKTIDMVSTLTVIEACRKAVLGRDLFDIYHSCIDDRRVAQKHNEAPKNNEKQRLIITACFTGEGASEKLKEIIRQDVGDENIEVRPLNIISKNEFTNAVHVLSEDYVILAIISTIPVQIEGYRYIGAMDYLGGKAKDLLKEWIKQDASMRNVAQSLKEHIRKWDSEDLVIKSQQLLQILVKNTGSELPEEVFTGMLLHLCFLVERKLNGEAAIKFEQLESFEREYETDFKLFRKLIRPFEIHFNIGIEIDEIAHLIRMFKENGVSSPILTV